MVLCIIFCFGGGGGWGGGIVLLPLVIYRVRVILQNEQEWDVETVVYEGANDNGFVWEVSVHYSNSRLE